ncbi:uncharacterized protein VP01_909g5, partial [Puccinia sorghi]
LKDTWRINSVVKSSKLHCPVDYLFSNLILLPSSHCSFLWQCNVLHLKPDHRVWPNILWIPTWSVADDAHPLIFEVPSSQFLAQFGTVAIQWTPWIKFPTPHAGHEGRATSPAQDEDPTQLFLKLLQTLKTPSSSGPKFCTPGMKPPDEFNGGNPLKLQGFHQSFKLLFSNEHTVFLDDCNKILYAASYLGGRASQWFEPYLDLLENQSPSCLINN